MDTNQEYCFLTHTHKTLPPAQLFIGQHAQALEAVELFLQKMLCKNNGCNTCIMCLQIREKQHHALMWLHPEKNYTIDQFDDLFTTLSLQLQSDELFFFIIQKADFLTAACANKLLKPMEEPPTGYHFILLAERVEQIVPTITSRCVIYKLDTATSAQISHPLFEVFTKKIAASNDFSKIIDSANINERESMELLDQILHYWFTKYQQDKTTHVIPLITMLQKAQLQPPMPGSSITFWRNLYLQLCNDLVSIN
ncbi:MAG TPA: hypothetical protein VJJ26_04545 [Candidatus Babeliales bacterium]|nr:hypothetical protein [Candidatus Babeliales bacterium]